MKAVFVDGASLFSMGAALGLKRFSFLGLYDLLTQDIGVERRLATIPLITLRQDMASALGKAFTGAGFEVVPAQTSDGSDDRVIIERIKALDVERVKELVIVSSDRDFTPVVKFKVMEGLRDVYWVATKRLRPDDRSSMSHDLKRLLKQPGFTFVELDKHRGRLAFEERRAPPESAPPLAAASTA